MVRKWTNLSMVKDGEVQQQDSCHRIIIAPAVNMKPTRMVIQGSMCGLIGVRIVGLI